jgi:hypothetical protein
VADPLKILDKNAVIRHIEFFKNCHQGKFSNNKIDNNKSLFPVGQNEKSKLFGKIITKFHVTLVNDSFKDFTEQIFLRILTDDFNPKEEIEGNVKVKLKTTRAELQNNETPSTKKQNKIYHDWSVNCHNFEFLKI